jgi:hypothetical protein
MKKRRGRRGASPPSECTTSQIELAPRGSLLAIGRRCYTRTGRGGNIYGMKSFSLWQVVGIPT